MMLLAGLCFEDTECDEIVLDLLEGGQRRLAIIRGRCVESRNGCIRGCPSPAGIKQSLHSGWTYSPETARPIEPVRDRCSFESDGGPQHHSWEEGRAGDADLLRCGGHPALRGCDILSPLQQIPMHAQRNIP